MILMIAKQFTTGYESAQILINPQDRLKHKIEDSEDYYIISFNEGYLCSLLFVIISTLGASFSPLLSRPSRQFGC